MKQTIEIEVPDGYKLVYNAKSGKVEIIPENIIDRIKTYNDAATYLKYLDKQLLYHNESTNSLAQLQTILDALNEGYKFNLLTGIVWYPWVRFYRVAPKNANVIGHFSYQGKKFALVGGHAASNGSSAGLGLFFSFNSVGDSWTSGGMLACKSREIAEYVSTQFGKLIFEACFARHFDSDEFEWID